MSHAEIIRAWKDPEYRSTLAAVPAHPAGVIEFAGPDLSVSSVNKHGGFGLERVRNKSTTCGVTKNVICKTNSQDCKTGTP